MFEQDQKLRQTAFVDGFWNVDVDERNTARLKDLISWFGWPTKSLVGAQAASAAWLLTQHADHDVAFQQNALKLMRQARKARPSDVALPDIAQLTDRVLINCGQPQLFGTQFIKKGKTKVLQPLKDPRRVNQRRAKFELPPLPRKTTAAKKKPTARKKKKRSAKPR